MFFRVVAKPPSRKNIPKEHFFGSGGVEAEAYER